MLENAQNALAWLRSVILSEDWVTPFYLGLRPEGSGIIIYIYIYIHKILQKYLYCVKKKWCPKGNRLLF